MKHNLDQLIGKLLAADTAALARILSLIENSSSHSARISELLYPHTGKAYVIGVTGAPGVGKSTLVDALVLHLAQGGSRVAVLAVDPSSPYSGGALLGDRIRMSKAAALGVFIRSMATRGALGGLAAKTPEALFAMDAAGYDYIVVETVGVGQAEVEIVRTADTVLVTLIPGLGDGVQALKAGIIEIADVFVINKADYEHADRLERELITVMSLAGANSIRPEIVRTVATESKGIQELAAAIEKHRASAQSSGAAVERKKQFLTTAFRGQLEAQFLSAALRFAEEKGILPAVQEKLLARSQDPGSLAAELILAFRQARD